MFTEYCKFLIYFSVLYAVMSAETLNLEEKFMKDLLSEEDKDMPRNILVERNSRNVQIDCKTTQRVSKIVWRIETINIKKFIAIIAENGKISKGWKETHAINASLPGQNTLIIKDALIKNAGKYSCQLFYNSLEPQTFYSEIIIVATDPQTGLIQAPTGYYNWVMQYSGNLKPFFRCSNNEDINSVQKSDHVSDFPNVNLTFNGCFTDTIPETCTLMTADYFNNRFTYFKTYNITTKDQDVDKAGWNEMNETEKINLITFPPDRIIMLDSHKVLEFECDLSPVPNHYNWIHINQDKQCSVFEQNLKKMNKNDQKYYIASSTSSSSNLFIYDFGASAAGKYLCIGTYWTRNIKKHFSSAELIIVITHDDYVIMYLVEETTDLFMVKFEIVYRGNLKPILQCSSVRILTTKTSLDFQNIKAVFIAEIALKGIPMACRCSFHSENTNKTIFFKNIYVRVVKNPSKLSQDFEFFPSMKPIEEYNMEEVQSPNRQFYEIPKSIIIPNNAKSAMFTCEMDREAVSLTWEFTSLLRHFKGAIIFQTKVGLSPYVSERYQVDVSKLGVYSLIIKKIIPEVIGTYKCSMLYNDKENVFYTAYLVVAHVYPMYMTKNSGPKKNGVFTSVVKYFGKMQPFLKCTSGEELYPTQLLDYKETSTKVLFKKIVNHTQFPFYCDVWFRDEEGETIRFLLGTAKNTFLKNKIAFLKNFHNILNCNPILIIVKFLTFLIF